MNIIRKRRKSKQNEEDAESQKAIMRKPKEKQENHKQIIRKSKENHKRHAPLATRRCARGERVGGADSKGCKAEPGLGD